MALPGGFHAPQPTVTRLPLAASSVTAKVRVAVSPASPSATLGEEIDSAGGLSSSTTLRVTGAEFATATVPPVEAIPQILTVWSGSSMVSPTAATVTVPTPRAAAGAKVSVVPELSAKSPASVPAPGAAETVTVTAWCSSTGLSTAVTVATPPLSAIELGDSDSATTEPPSSSTSVSVSAAGFASAPLPPATVPVTVAWRLTVSSALSTAVTVTAPVLAVAPAATVRVFAADSAKSPAIVSVPAAAAAATVTVTASLEGWERVAVTDATPAFSRIEDGASTSATVGIASSSRICRYTGPVEVTVCPSTAAAATVAETVTRLAVGATAGP